MGGKARRGKVVGGKARNGKVGDGKTASKPDESFTGTGTDTDTSADTSAGIDFHSLIEEAKGLNSDVFSLIRLQLLANLAVTGQDGASYREMKAWLQLGDGALYSNLVALEKMGYVEQEKIETGGKKLKAYHLTAEGMAEWLRVRDWLHRFVGCGVRT